MTPEQIVEQASENRRAEFEAEKIRHSEALAEANRRWVSHVLPIFEAKELTVPQIVEHADFNRQRVYRLFSLYNPADVDINDQETTNT